MGTWRRLLPASQATMLPLETRWPSAPNPTWRPANKLGPERHFTHYSLAASQEPWFPVVMNPEAFMTTCIKDICETAYSALVTDSPLLWGQRTRAITRDPTRAKARKPMRRVLRQRGWCSHDHPRVVTPQRCSCWLWGAREGRAGGCREGCGRGTVQSECPNAAPELTTT